MAWFIDDQGAIDYATKILRERMEKINAQDVTIKTQDATIRALVRAIQDAIDANPTELNLENYHHDDVCKLQDEAIAVYYILNAALAAVKEPT